MINKDALLIIKVDTDALTAVQTWHDKLGASDKAGFIVDEVRKTVIGYEDPANKLEAKRTELVDLVKLNAKQATGVVEIVFNLDGTNVDSISTRIDRVADPEDEPK